MRASILTDINHDICVIEDSAIIGPFCTVGLPGECIDTYPNLPDGKPEVVIEENAILTKHVTVDAPARTNLTYIGPDCFIMAHTHIGHDAILHRGVRVAPFSCIGGRCEVGKYANIGTGTVIHQRVDIGEGVMIGMNTTVTKHVPPFCLVRMHMGRLCITRINYKYFELLENIKTGEKILQKDVLELKNSFKNVILRREVIDLETTDNALLRKLQRFVNDHTDGKLLQDFIDWL